MVVDEAHLLAMPERGGALEAGIMRFTRRNPNARVVLLSATMPNVAQLGEWLTTLNSKPTLVIESEWRPTQLGVEWPVYKSTRNYHVNEGRKRALAMEILAQHPQDKFLVFVHSKRAGRELLQALHERRETAEFHNADLSRDRRLGLERRFRHGDLRICICTSTLAYGINMPARRVIVLGVHRGLSLVDPIDVKQEVGRAGRVGLDPRGDAYVLLPDREARELQRDFSRIGPVKSVINDEDTLAFHLVAEIAEGEVSSVGTATSWWGRSLASFQRIPIGIMMPSGCADIPIRDLTRILGKLEAVKVIRAEGDTYETTQLGRVSSWLYFSPFDVAGWYFNMKRAGELDRLKDDAVVAWALGAVKTAYGSFLPREHESDMSELRQRLRARGIVVKGPLPAAVLAFEGILTGRSYKFMAGIQRALARDVDRIVQAIKLIDDRVLRALGADYCDLLGLRLRYSCTWQEAELCVLPGIGAKRAARLIGAGIHTVAEVATNEGVVVEALGKARARPAIGRARELTGEEED